MVDQLGEAKPMGQCHRFSPSFWVNVSIPIDSLKSPVKTCCISVGFRCLRFDLRPRNLGFVRWIWYSRDACPSDVNPSVISFPKELLLWHRFIASGMWVIYTYANYHLLKKGKVHKSWYRLFFVSFYTCVFSETCITIFWDPLISRTPYVWQVAISTGANILLCRFDEPLGWRGFPARHGGTTNSWMVYR